MTGDQELDDILTISYEEADLIILFRDRLSHQMDIIEKSFRANVPEFFVSAECDQRLEWIRNFTEPYWLGIGTELDFCGPKFSCEIRMKALNNALCRLLWERLELGPYPKTEIMRRGME